MKQSINNPIALLCVKNDLKPLLKDIDTKLRLLSHHPISIICYTFVSVCVGISISFHLNAGDRNIFLTSQKYTVPVANAELQNEGLQKTLELNFSPENREKLRKALDDYARTVDQDHEQIEARRRAMRESIEARFLDADRDFDNTIDRQEATEKLPQIARHFSAVDTNQDGVISLDELEAAQLRLEEHRKAAEAALELQKIQEVENANTLKRKGKQAANTTRKPSL